MRSIVNITISSSYVLIIPPPLTRLGAGGSTFSGCLTKYILFFFIVGFSFPHKFRFFKELMELVIKKALDFVR